MIYRRLGRTGLKVSRLGFGAMRLPARADGKTDVEASIGIIHRAFELGVNYIDTAVGYCGGESQVVVGQALKGWRDKVYVSTKNHYYGTDEAAWWKNLENSIERLDVDYIDVYNFHGMRWEAWEKFVQGPKGMLTWMRKAKDQGLIRHICCSFHDSAEALSKLGATDEISAITLQYNLLYRDLEEVFPELVARDIGITVMGPVGGGRLGVPSAVLGGLVKGAASTPELALRFVFANPTVSTAISGMNTLEQVEQNCAVASREEPLTDSEHAQIAENLERLNGLAKLYCTGCNYCLPCPHGVNIPGSFLAVNYDRVYGLKDVAKAMYGHVSGKAVYCVACGKCEPKCPQHIPIRVQLREAAAMFDADYGKMAFDLRAVRRDEDGIEFRARLHNRSDRPAKAHVELKASDGMALSPVTIDAEIEEPFQRAGETLQLPIPDAGRQRLRIDAAIEDPTGTRTEAIQFALGSCYRVESIEDLRGRVGELVPIAIDRPDQVLGAAGPAEPLYVLKAWPGYTDESFLLYARITDGTQGAEEHVKVTSRAVDILLDVRDREDDLPIGFHKSMVMLRVPLKADASQAQVLRGSMDPSKPVVRTGAVAEGIEVQIEVPWALLTEDSDMDDRGFDTGEAFGLDLVLGAADDMDRPLFRAAWSSNPRVQADARMGTLFFT